MKNRIWVFVVAFVAIALFSTEGLLAQKITVDSTPNQYIGTNSYNDYLVNNLFHFNINLQSGNNISLKGWSLKIKVNEQVQNANGKLFDKLDKVKFRVNGSSILGQGTWRELSSMTSQDDIPIIDKSMTSLENGSKYKRIQIGFDVMIEGGSYLENLRSETEYRVYFTFTLLDSDNNPIASPVFTLTTLDLGIRPPAPVVPTFGFEVSADASLNFNVPEDYTRKVESSEDSWLKVTSKDKGYTVSVQTSDSYFEGESDVPVGIVSMQVEDKKDSRTGSEVSLKNSDQTVFTGNATGSEPRKLDVRYFITENEAKGLATYRPGAYTTRLTYTLLPQ